MADDRVPVSPDEIMPTVPEPKPQPVAMSEIADGQLPVHDEPDHTHFYDRIIHGTIAAQHIAQQAAERAKERFGEDPIGFIPGGDAHKFMEKIGLFRDPENARFGDTLRLGYETILKPTAGLADIIMRSGMAATGGIGGAVGQSLYETGLVDQGMAERAKRDVTNALDITAMFGGMRGSSITRGGAGIALEAPVYRAARTIDGLIHDEPIGGKALAADFHDVGRAVSATIKEDGHDVGAGAIQATQKTRALYDEYGIHPNEVLADVAKDPALAKDLASDNPVLPERYTGFDPEKMHTTQLEADAKARGEAAPPRIEGVSAQLSDALEPRTAWPDRGDPTREAPGANFTRPAQTWLGQHISNLLDRWDLAGDLVRDLQIKLTPMAARDATVEARATAKQFASTMRVMAYDYRNIHGLLTKEFTPERLKAMWEAVDHEDAVKMGSAVRDPAKGLSSLSPTESAVVQKLRDRMAQTWKEATETPGLMRGEPGKGIEFYVPRMVQFLESAGADMGGARQLTPLGQEVRTSSSRLRKRYSTLEETETAAGKAGGAVVRDIRTLNLANAELQRAITGKRLLNAIKEAGEKTSDIAGDPHGAEPTVVVGAVPKDTNYKWFTIGQNSAFWENRPKFGPGGIVKDEAGKVVFDRAPVYVRSDFEGPLRSVMTTPDGAMYRAAMDIKSKVTSAIMFSPLLHNAVIFGGRVLPAAYGNPYLAIKMYFEGNKLKNDPAMMRHAIENGLVPMLRDGVRMDLSSMGGPESMMPGRSITSKIAAYIPGLFDENAGTAVKRAIDKAGDFWHGTMLWDRIADVQMGIWKHYYDDALRNGLEPSSAAKLAGNFANQYAGVLSPEAMSQMARKFANIVMFSRSFTLGNIGASKALFTGLPRDVLAQIQADSGIQEMLKTNSYAQRKAISIAAIDLGLYFLSNSAMQSAVQAMRGQDNAGDTGYLDRFKKALGDVSRNPYQVMTPWGIYQTVQSLTPNSQNEPGKEDQIFAGYQSDGTAIYMRNPLGKVTGDQIGWISRPSDMINRKMSTLIKPGIDIMANRDYAGRPIYNPYWHTPQDVMNNVGKMVFHYLSAQAPSDAMAAGWELLHGKPTPDEKTMDVLKIAGPMLGAMFSHGFPGGPAMGEVFRNQKEAQTKLQEVSADVRKFVKEGREDEARALMQGAGVDPKFQQYIIDGVMNPERSFLKSRTQKFIMQLPQEQQARIRFMFDHQGRPADVPPPSE